MEYPNHMILDVRPGYIPVVYELLATGTTVEDEPMALCTTWYARSQAAQQQRLVAWHYPASGQPVAMPVEWLGASAPVSYGVGQFIVLPHRAMTLTLVDAGGRSHALADIELVPSGRPRRFVDLGPSDWDLLVTWSDGVDVELERRSPANSTRRVGEASLSLEQCSAFLRLGGMLRADPQSTGDIVSAAVTCVPLESGDTGFVLWTETIGRGAVSAAEGCIARTVYACLQEALEHGRIDLDACWLLLPPRCQRCQLPVLAGDVCVQTLWGTVHAPCLEASRMQGACSPLLVVPETVIFTAGQLALPWVGSVEWG
jgi:hypothetical protein